MLLHGRDIKASRVHKISLHSEYTLLTRKLYRCFLEHMAAPMASVSGNHVSVQPPSSESASSSFWPLFHYAE